MRPLYLVFLVALTGFLVPHSPALAQPVVPVGSQFQVNAYTSNSQVEARVVWDGVDGFVVVWDSRDQDGSFAGLVARRVDAAGGVSGGEFVVNSYTTGPQRKAEVSADGAGGFVVVFENYQGTASDPTHPIHFRAFDSSDVPLFDDFQVNTTTTGDQGRPSVARTPTGDYLVSFLDDSPGLVDVAVRLRRIDSGGVGVGSDFEIQELLADSGYPTHISSDGGDGFVVVWQSRQSAGSDSIGKSIQARRVDPAGQPIGAQFQVNSFTEEDQYKAYVSPDGDGGFVVSWSSHPFDDGTTEYDIVARRFLSDGTPRGVEFTVSTESTPGSFREWVRSAADSNGGFLTVWEDEGPDPGTEILARRVDSTGVPGGEPFLVNDYTTGGQSEPSVAATPDGEFLVVWDGIGVGTDANEGIHARRLAFDDDEDGVGNPVDDCTDTDGDGFGDPGYPANTCTEDNCPDDFNANQVDFDSDGVGDECDVCLGSNETGDSDGDGVCDDLDFCVGDDFSGDMDGDGLCASSPTECDDNDPTNACAPVFGDGFESGDTTAWSATVY